MLLKRNIKKTFWKCEYVTIIIKAHARMAPTTINTTGDKGFDRCFTTSVGFLRYIKPFFFFRFGKKFIKHSISSSSRFKRKIGWRPSRERAKTAERAFAPPPITRPAGLARFFEERYEASQGILRVGNWSRKPPISAFRTPKTLGYRI